MFLLPKFLKSQQKILKLASINNLKIRARLITVMIKLFQTQTS